ncbi:MAG: VOC family protein [Actinomycetota bacterium]
MVASADGFQPEINAITFSTADMARAVRFYETLGLPVVYGGGGEPFSTLQIGSNYVNLTTEGAGAPGFWGRVVFHVPDPDAVWRTLVDAGYEPAFEPRDAPWGERYFHVVDPDGHELSFARRLDEGDGSP